MADEAPIPASVLRALGERNYDRRKTAAEEIQKIVAAHRDSGSKDGITSVVRFLNKEMLQHSNPHHRKGGLIALAGVAIGLSGSTELYLEELLPPVIVCFEDAETRVRYYACESMYNIAKVARSATLPHFATIFDGLCRLFADVDVDVKNAAQLLDRLVKDIVTESDSFDVERFIPLLQKHIRTTNPYVRQLLVGWITVLDSVPDINLLDFLPEFLDGLFNMLSDGNREIRQAADSALADFLKELKLSSDVDFSRMVGILVEQCSSKDKFNRLTALSWVHEFIKLGGEKLASFYADLLSAMLRCISDGEAEIRQEASRANAKLLGLVKSSSVELDLHALLGKLTFELVNHYVPTRMTSLRWISTLLERSPEEMREFIDELFPVLLKTLSDVSDDVVLLDLEVLARISLDEREFTRVLHNIVRLFGSDRRLLESRGNLIVRKLCMLLNAEAIYLALANILAEEEDHEFAALMVQTLNIILLTAVELGDLRNVLKRTVSGGDKERAVFKALFESWSHNAVATFSLCLLAQAYELAASLIHKFGSVEVTVGFLMQIDKLVQLLESPIFLHVRLELLNSDAPGHDALLKALYGLLMVLPQSTAFKTLHERLSSVSSLLTTLPHSESKPGLDASVLDTDALLATFDTVQAKHAAAVSAVIHKRSLLSASREESKESEGEGASA